MRQILILEDLGISRNLFEEKAKEAGINHQIVWEESQANSEEVEIIVNVKKKIDAALIRQYPNLKMIGVAFTGYDSVDPKASLENGIAVYNVPAYSTDSVAELAVGLAISLLREIPRGNQQIRQNQWDLRPGFDLKGKTVGIMGTGAIGLATARLFKAFGCKLIAWSRTEKEDFKQLGGRYIQDKTDFFAQADIISLHVPSNSHTAGLVGADELKAMKNSAYLINTARGPIIDEDTLYESLKNNEIAGAALDVFTVEPIPENHPFLSLNNTILTPHVAYKTEEALERRAAVTIQNILDFLNGKTDNRVN